MFANAGMVQFKNVFTGAQKRPAPRAATVQKCIRISGKHNDLENVGRTSRHHTFFEMLGNFSFGDYFKQDACRFGWSFLTEVLGLDEDRLWVSVFAGDEKAPRDEEALKIWRDELKVSPDRILEGTAKDNFWSMGDTGPCGPCSEIMYDRGESFGEASLENGERFFELWNLVFMQYSVETAGGPMNPLPAPCIDTGAGLERIASVMQGVDSNYDIDVFTPLVNLAADLSGKKYGAAAEDDVSMRVIADHARMAAHLISEGVFPEKTAREYVLRRVMRRAIRHGHRLGLEDLFFHRVADEVVDVMGDAYPELVERRTLIERICRQEEERFRMTLSRGLELLGANTDWNAGPAGEKILPGAIAFDLSATYGFPLDLIEVIGEEEGFTVDEAGFEKAEAAHKSASGAGKIGEKAVSSALSDIHSRLGDTIFTGYDGTSAETTICALVVDGTEVDEAVKGDRVEVILTATPFYGESGGQVGDTGEITTGGARVRVTDTARPISGLTVHVGVVEDGTIRVGEQVDARVDEGRRWSIRRHHTATHLLHSALRELLGAHATQKGSRVAPELLRFDFTHFEPLTGEQIETLERAVAAAVLANEPVDTKPMSYDEAKKSGAMAIFEENYGDQVRVVFAGEGSRELCGGVHVNRTGDIGPFFILSETGIASGVRRIEAVAGTAALEWFAARRRSVEEAAATIKANPENLGDKLAKLVSREKELSKEVEELKRQLASGGATDITSNVREVAGVKVLGVKLPVGDPGTMRTTADELKEKLGSAVICLAGENKGKAAVLVAVTKDLVDRLRASDLIKPISAHVGGRGGGRPDMAQAGGQDTGGLDDAAQAIYRVVEEALAK